MVHQPIEPSALEISSIARNTVSGASSGPPIERGRNICKSPARARAFAARGGTRRICSPSSRAARISGTSPLAAVTTSTSGSGQVLSLAAICALLPTPCSAASGVPNSARSAPKIVSHASGIARVRAREGPRDRSSPLRRVQSAPGPCELLAPCHCATRRSGRDQTGGPSLRHRPCRTG